MRDSGSRGMSKISILLVSLFAIVTLGNPAQAADANIYLDRYSPSVNTWYGSGVKPTLTGGRASTGAGIAIRPSVRSQIGTTSTVYGIVDAGWGTVAELAHSKITNSRSSCRYRTTTGSSAPIWMICKIKP